MKSGWPLLVLCTIGTIAAQSGYSRDSPSNQLQYDSSKQDYSNDDDDEIHGDEIPGEAGTDYPNYTEVPDTGFTCDNYQFPGYYADPQAQCQAFYVCQKGGHKDAFLCPIGTIFNQEVLVCDWWYNVDCSKAEELYSRNELIVKAMEEADARLAQQKQSSGYQTQNGYQASSNGKQGSSNGNGNKQQGSGYQTQASSNGNHANRLTSNGNGIKPVYGPPSNDITDVKYTPNGNGGNGIKPVYGVPSNDAAGRLESLGNGNGYQKNGNGQKNGGNRKNGNGNGNHKNGNGFHKNGGNGNSIKPVYGPPSGSSQERTYLPPGTQSNGNHGSNNGFGHVDNSIDVQSSAGGPIDESVDVFQPFNSGESAPSRTYLPPV